MFFPLMWFFILGLALGGLAVGSFLTVVVTRIGTGGTILWGRSRCIHCGKNLSWFELLPVVSFIAQGGQCRSCGGAIPLSYPAIELTTAALFAWLGLAMSAGSLALPPFPGGAAATLLYYVFFLATAVAVSWYDLLHRLIPAALILPLSALGLAAHLAGALQAGALGFLAFPFIVAVASFGLFWGLWFFSRGRAMGRGDADVALAIALALGPQVAIVGILLALWIGAFLGIVLVAAGKLSWKSALPFAPFLFFGAIVALLAGQYLITLVAGYGL